MKKKHWYDYLWIWSIIYFTLGFFNILFAWLGMIDFLVPVFIAVFGRNKWFCNNLCGRGQLFALLGGKYKCSRNRPTPRFLVSPWFRYGFLAFFMATPEPHLSQYTDDIHPVSSHRYSAARLLPALALTYFPHPWHHLSYLLPQWYAIRQ